ncbi:MAG: hypothetical protein ACT4O4_10445 [Nitrospiraceae bacterium]
MKNQYFGDVHDYRKYGLLRAIQTIGTGKLLVAWMLTSDDKSRDGRFRSYLQDPDAWKRYDPELFDGLEEILRPAPAPKVSLIEGSQLLPRTTYYSAVVPDARQDREAWCEGLLCATRGSDLVFVDPDNGIEVPSKLLGRKGSSKYVTWLEIQEIWQVGCSILVYQHFRHEQRAAFAKRMMMQLREKTGARLTEAFRTPHVLFLLAAQDRHVPQFRQMIPLLSQKWNGQIEPMGLGAC